MGRHVILPRRGTSGPPAPVRTARRAGRRRARAPGPGPGPRSGRAGPPPARPGRAAPPAARVCSSRTTSGTAAARHATIGKPAAMASRNTIPKPSWTEGRQNTSAFAYASKRSAGERSPSSATVSVRPSLARCACSASHSGPFPTMRTFRSGIPSRRSAAASRRSPIRLRAYIRATESTVGPVRGRCRAPARPARHASRSIGSGTTARRLGRDAVLRLRHAGLVAARHHHQVGARAVHPLPARLEAEEQPHPAPLVPELVGDDALEAHHERHAPAPGPPEAVQVDADDEVASPPADAARGAGCSASGRACGTRCGGTRGRISTWWPSRRRPSTRPLIPTNVPLPSNGLRGVEERTVTSVR